MRISSDSLARLRRPAVSKPHKEKKRAQHKLEMLEQTGGPHM